MRGKWQRRIKALLIGPKEGLLVVEVLKCECRACGKSFEVLGDAAAAVRA